jgi:hypothetical protein
MKSLSLLLILSSMACSPKTSDATDSGSPDSGGDTQDTAPPLEFPETYAFDSAFDEASSVSYSGQSFRQLLMVEMKGYLGDLTARLDDTNNPYVPQPGEVAAALDFYFSFDGDIGGEVALTWSGAGPALQSTYGEVANGKSLVGKIAGNDPTGQHRDWNTDFVGWNDSGVSTPESLVRHWFDVIDAQAVAWTQGSLPVGIDGQAVSAVYITPEGHNLQQLLQKFLSVSVAFSQASDDYMDDDLEGKGLNAPNDVAKAGENYTELEHAWDEGFGYFGAAQNYGQMTDEENQAASNGFDANDDGFIDLLSEVNWGHSVNAAKRDRGASDDATTDFTQNAWAGFSLGRALIAETAGIGLSGAQAETLADYRDQAISAWERAIAATVVHYLNACIQDLDPDKAVNTSDFIKHWSELKGFALGFQFNPHSPMSETEFTGLHQLIGTAPIMDLAYRVDLQAARDIVSTVFDFDPANQGDAEGENGW